MNADYLLKHFDRLAEAPDAIANLRRFILDLALRGKLVEQNPKDEPAAELLMRIEKEKAKSEKKPEKLEPVESEAIPFIIPSSWKVVRMGWLARKLGAGSTPLGGKNIYQNEGVPFLRSQNVHNDGLRLDDVALIPRAIHERMSGTHIQKDDVLLNITGASIGRCALVPSSFKEGNVSQHVAIIRLLVPEMRNFIHLSLISPFFQKHIDDVQVGVSREGLSMQGLKLFPMLIPPLAEQHRIVARVDELMALCDQLETAKAEREQTRDRLVVSTLHSLNEPEASQDQARFTFDNLPSLTTRVEHIKQLRQSILNLAVRGKLVKQDPKDEPAGELLKRIEREKEKRFKRGELKKQETYSQVQSDKAWFDIPLNWCWVKLGNITQVVMGQSPPGDTYNKSGEGIPLINGPVEFTEGHFGKTVVNQFTTSPTNFCEEGDLLLCVRGSTTGRTNIAGFKACIGRGVAAIRPYFADQYVRLFIWRLRASIIAMGRGVAFPSVSKQQIEELPVPFPPLAEQHRIVAKVDELMALCDQLEAQIETTETDSRRLLEAVLHEALAGEGALASTGFDRLIPGLSERNLDESSSGEKPQQSGVEVESGIPKEAVPVYVKRSPVDSKGRVAFDCYVLKVLASDKYLGRTKMEKIDHLVEYHCGLDLGRRPVRDQFGPVDFDSRLDVERLAGFQKWFITRERTGRKTDYLPGPEMPQALEIAEEFMGERRAAVDALLELMRTLKTEASEIVATLYASWNDFLLDGKTPSDEEIVNDVHNNWHPEKKKIPASEWKTWLGWMRKKGLVPRGTGRPVPHRVAT